MNTPSRGRPVSRALQAMLSVSLLLGIVCVVEARAQEVQVVVSSAGGDRLTTKAPVKFAPSQRGTRATFTIHASAPLQRIIGFGASFQEAGMISLNALPRAKQDDVLRALFDPLTGAGFSVMATYIGGTDFMAAGPWFTYDDTPGDVELKHFTITRDLGPNGLVTYIKRAQRFGSFALHARMDYPPDWMLADAKTNQKQTIKPEYYEALAHYYLRYLEEYRKQGITIDYLDPFNEPGGYTKVTFEQIRDIIRDHVGPLFEKLGVTTKIQLGEAPFRFMAAQGYPTVLDDPRARKYISTIAYHGYDFILQGVAPPGTDLYKSHPRFRTKAPTRENGYDFEEFKFVEELHRRYPDLPLWMTEVCYFEQTPWIKPIPNGAFEDGDFWGQQIAAELAAGASGWTYWNAILDEKGGPWLVAPKHNDPDPNAQQPVVIVNRETGDITYTGLYYYLAHFSKFVRPGSVRLGTTGSHASVRLLAFRRPDGKLVVEIINSAKAAETVQVAWNGKAFAAELPAISISTYIWNEHGS